MIHFHPLDIVCRGSETQFQVGENETSDINMLMVLMTSLNFRYFIFGMGPCIIVFVLNVI